MLTVGSLFSGIGGIDLGLQWTGGFETRWFCEIDPWCRRVLAKHWPDVPCYEDVTTLDFETVEKVDVIAGGFPCQDISSLGEGAGLEGIRSGLWRAMEHAVRLVGPRFVLVENVPALRWRGLGTVLSDLAACGYDTWWDCIPASAFGAPHQRDRLFVVAHTEGFSQREPADETDAITTSGQAWPQPRRSTWWDTEPRVCRVVDGISPGVDRRRGLGNAVVPQVVEHIGHLILGAA